MPAVRDPRFPAADAAVVPRIIRRRAAEHPDRTFAVFSDGTSWSYGALADIVWRRANGFAAAGVRRGDYVSSWLPTGKAALETWFGLESRGARYAPLNTAYKGRILDHAL